MQWNHWKPSNLHLSFSSRLFSLLAELFRMGRKWARTCMNWRKFTRSSLVSAKNAWTMRSHNGLMANSGMRRKSSRDNVPQSVRSNDVKREYKRSIWFGVTGKQRNLRYESCEFRCRALQSIETKIKSNWFYKDTNIRCTRFFFFQSLGKKCIQLITYSPCLLGFEQFPLDAVTMTIYCPFWNTFLRCSSGRKKIKWIFHNLPKRKKNVCVLLRATTAVLLEHIIM